MLIRLFSRASACITFSVKKAAPWLVAILCLSDRGYCNTILDRSYIVSDKCAYSYTSDRYLGIWNAATNTCTLTEDITDSLVLGLSGYVTLPMTIDCAGKIIMTGPDQI